MSVRMEYKNTYRWKPFGVRRHAGWWQALTDFISHPHTHVDFLLTPKKRVSIFKKKLARPQNLWGFQLKDLSIDKRVGAWYFVCGQAQQGLTVGFLLLQYSVVYTDDPLSLFNLLLNHNLYVLGDINR